MTKNPELIALTDTLDDTRAAIFRLSEELLAGGHFSSEIIAARCLGQFDNALAALERALGILESEIEKHEGVKVERYVDGVIRRRPGKPRI